MQSEGAVVEMADIAMRTDDVAGFHHQLELMSKGKRRNAGLHSLYSEMRFKILSVGAGSAFVQVRLGGACLTHFHYFEFMVDMRAVEDLHQSIRAVALN
jgi:hypothetical protein